MTRNEARKLIKTYTLTRYSNSALLLLLRIVDLTYRTDKDNAEREVETTTASLTRAAGIGERQLANILSQLKQDGVLLDLSQSAKHIKCRLNLQPLTQLEPYGEKQKAEKKALADDRARKAREKRADIRTFHDFDNKVDDALSRDLAEFTIKQSLLKDVKDQNIKRMMMNWDIERIRRAKANAEKMLASTGL